MEPPNPGGLQVLGSGELPLAFVAMTNKASEAIPGNISHSLSHCGSKAATREGQPTGFIAFL